MKSNRYTSTIIKYIQETILLLPLFVAVLNIKLDLSILACILIGIFILYMLGLAIGYTAKNKKKWIKYLSTLVTAILVCCIAQIAFGLSVIKVFIIAIFCIVRGFMIYRSYIYNIYYLVVSLVAYVAMSIAIKNLHYFESFEPFLVPFGIISVFIILLTFNKNHITGIDKRDTGIVYGGVKRYNYKLVTGVFIFVLAISYGKTLYNFIVNSIRYVIGMIIAILSKLLPKGAEDIGPNNTKNQQLFPMDKVEPNDGLLGKIIYYIALTIAIIILIVFIIYAVKKIYKLIKKLIKYMTKRLSEKDVEQVVYVEETEQLFDIDKLRTKYSTIIKDKLNNMFKKPIKWSELTNKQKVRHLYKNVIMGLDKKGYQYSKSYTPNEILSDISNNRNEQALDEDFVNDYNKARYSNEEIDDTIVKKYFDKYR